MYLLQIPEHVRQIIDEWISHFDVEQLKKACFDAECGVFFEELKREWVVWSANSFSTTMLIVPKNAPNWFEVRSSPNHFTDDQSGISSDYEIWLEGCIASTPEAAMVLVRYVRVLNRRGGWLMLREEKALEALKDAPTNLGICPIARPLYFIREAVAQGIDLKLVRPGDTGGYSTQEEREANNSHEKDVSLNSEMRLPESVRRIVTEEWKSVANVDDEAERTFIFDEEKQILFYPEEKTQHDFKRQLYVSDNKYEWWAACKAKDPGREDVCLIIPKNGKNCFEVSKHAWRGDWGISGRYEIEIQKCPPNPTFEMAMKMIQCGSGLKPEEVLEALKNAPTNLGTVYIEWPLRLIRDTFNHGIYLRLSRSKDRGGYSTAEEFG